MAGLGNLAIGTASSGTFVRVYVGGTLSGNLSATFDTTGINLPAGFTFRVGGVPISSSSVGPNLALAGTLAVGTTSIFTGKASMTATSVNAGLNVGSYAGIPGSLLNGDIFYNSSTNQLQAQISGVTTSIGGRSLAFSVNGGGAALTTGIQTPIKIPYGGTIMGWTLFCSPSGACSFDIYRAANGTNMIPTGSIIGTSGIKPYTTGSSTNSYENSSAAVGTGWNYQWASTTLTGLDNVALVVNSVDGTGTTATLVLYYQ